MIKLTSGIIEYGKLEFYLVGMETYESFDLVIAELQQLKISLLDKLDGIYWRTALFESRGKRFKMIFHEDIGIYGFSIGEGGNDDWLQRILAAIVARINE